MPIMNKSTIAGRIGAVWAAGLLALAAATLALPARAADGQAAYYYDGGRRIELAVQADLVADFRRPRVSALDADERTAPQRVAGDSLVRIERLSDTNASARAAAASGRSPVFRQGGTPAGRLMALPGGVLVKFKPDWSQSQIDQWLAARGLPAGRPLAIGAGWMRVDTPSGQAALDAANLIQESGEVLAASPNWWTQTAAR